MRKGLLSVGTNHTLLGIRNTIFVNAGYAVVPAKSAAAALRAIRSRNLAAVIVGHALSPTLKERITEAGKQKQVPVIVLHASDFEHPILAADANLCGLDGAATVLEVLAKLICSASTRDPHRTTICASRPHRAVHTGNRCGAPLNERLLRYMRNWIPELVYSCRVEPEHPARIGAPCADPIDYH